LETKSKRKQSYPNSSQPQQARTPVGDQRNAEYATTTVAQGPKNQISVQ